MSAIVRTFLSAKSHQLARPATSGECVCGLDRVQIGSYAELDEIMETAGEKHRARVGIVYSILGGESSGHRGVGHGVVLPLLRPGAIGREPDSPFALPMGGARAGATIGPRAVRLDACGDPGSCRRHDSHAASRWFRRTSEGAWRSGPPFCTSDCPSHGCGACGNGQAARVILAADEDEEPILLDERDGMSGISPCWPR
jgi:hypothetical protein